MTGLGAVTPLGRSANETWDALAAPRPGFSPFVEIPPARFELGGMACVRAGLVPEEFFSSFILHPSSLPPSRAARLAFAAAAEALGPDPEGRGTGIVTASNFGLVELAQPELARAVPEPGAAWQHFRHDTLTHALAEHFKLDGPRVAMSLSCASGASAIARAAGMIQRGEAQRVLAVGYDAVSLCAWSGLCALRTMAKEPPPRPFDRNRAGTVFAEGAGALLLESRESAKERGAAPAGALLGWATNNNAFHLTASPARGAGVADAARRALAAAGIQPRGVDYYNAHATATQQNDLTEFQALEDALSPALAREIPVAGHKGATGHLLGAAGAVESVMTLLAIREGVVPGTPQCLERDPETPVNLPATAVRQSIRCALKMSAGFGGCNTALLFAPP
ncbi:MAG: hypothetical protein FWF96_00060 [Kiritimatiellaeota bacterium]|nr:hypothetical protein [Kiritimatiellota bacterium]